MTNTCDVALGAKCFIILLREVGPVDAERFIAYVNRERMDYTQWRKQNLGVGETVDSLYEKICDYTASHADTEMAMA